MQWPEGSVGSVRTGEVVGPVGGTVLVTFVLQMGKRGCSGPITHWRPGAGSGAVGTYPRCSALSPALPAGHSARGTCCVHAL